MLSYNPALIGKLLNRAGHPGTLDVEALSAVRKAYALCSSHNVTLEDVAKVVSGDIFVKIADFPQWRFLKQIADLQVALDDARARIVAQADMIADLQRSEETNVSMKKADALTIATLQAEQEVDASTIAALEAEVASLNETVARQQDALATASAIASEPVLEPAMIVCVEPVVEKTVRRRATAKRTTSTGVSKSARIVTDELDEPVAGPSVETPQLDASSNTRSWSRAEWARFNVLATLGRATSSIARTMSREFGRVVSTACVGAMRRERWLSPGYGLA